MMRDHLRRYRAIREAFTQWYPGEPKGNTARHVTTLAAPISGMVASKSTQLPNIASQVPDSTQPDSRDRAVRLVAPGTTGHEVLGCVDVSYPSAATGRVSSPKLA
jgi:hypothetical protein